MTAHLLRNFGKDKQNEKDFKKRFSKTLFLDLRLFSMRQFGFSSEKIVPNWDTYSVNRQDPTESPPERCRKGAND